MSSIASENGFVWQTLWNLDENAELRAKRKSPFVLNPGDVVEIPPMRPKTVCVPTGHSHRFRRRGVPANLRVIVRELGQPVADAPYTLEVDGQERKGVTSSEGLLEEWVVPNASRVMLTLGQGDDAVVYDLRLRELDPVSETKGVQARLHNLGYYRGPCDGTLNEDTVRALREFQCENSLSVTGEADSPTREKLSVLHNS